MQDFEGQGSPGRGGAAEILVWLANFLYDHKKLRRGMLCATVLP